MPFDKNGQWYAPNHDFEEEQRRRSLEALRIAQESMNSSSDQQDSGSLFDKQSNNRETSNAGFFSRAFDTAGDIWDTANSTLDRFNRGVGDFLSGGLYSDFADSTIKKADEKGKYVPNSMRDASTPADNWFEKGTEYAGNVGGLLAGGQALKTGIGLMGKTPAAQGLARSLSTYKGNPLPSAAMSRSALSQIPKVGFGEGLAGAGVAGVGAKYLGDAFAGFNNPTAKDDPNTILGDGLLKKTGASWRSGTADLLDSVGQIGEMAGNRFGLDGLSKSGQDLQSFSQGQREGFEQPHKEFKWYSFLDPEYYATNASRSMPTSLALMPLSMVGMYAGAGIGAAAGIGAFGRGVLGALGGSATSTPLESAMEAAGVYKESVNRGLSEEESQANAQQAFMQNLAILGGTNALELGAAFAPMPKSFTKMGSKMSPAGQIAGRAGIAAVSEGSQEIAQEAVSRNALGDPFSLNDPQVQEAGFLGGLMGAGFAGAGALADPFQSIQSHVINSLPPEPRQRYDEVFDESRSNGRSPEQAKLEALDTIYTEYGPDVHRLIEESSEQILNNQDRENQTKRDALENPLPEIAPQTAPVDESVTPSDTEAPQLPETVETIDDARALKNHYRNEMKNETDPAKRKEISTIVKELADLEASMLLDHIEPSSTPEMTEERSPEIAPSVTEPLPVDRDIQVGDMVVLKGTKKPFEVMDTSDRSLLTLKNDRGNTLQTGRKNVVGFHSDGAEPNVAPEETTPEIAPESVSNGDDVALTELRNMLEEEGTTFQDEIARIKDEIEMGGFDDPTEVENLEQDISMLEQGLATFGEIGEAAPQETPVSQPPSPEKQESNRKKLEEFFGGGSGRPNAEREALEQELRDIEADMRAHGMDPNMTEDDYAAQREQKKKRRNPFPHLSKTCKTSVNQARQDKAGAEFHLQEAKKIKGNNAEVKRLEARISTEKRNARSTSKRIERCKKSATGRACNA